MRAGGAIRAGVGVRLGIGIPVQDAQYRVSEFGILSWHAKDARCCVSTRTKTHSENNSACARRRLLPFEYRKKGPGIIRWRKRCLNRVIERLRFGDNRRLALAIRRRNLFTGSHDACFRECGGASALTGDITEEIHPANREWCIDARSVCHHRHVHASHIVSHMSPLGCHRVMCHIETARIESQGHYREQCDETKKTFHRIVSSSISATSPPVKTRPLATRLIIGYLGIDWLLLYLEADASATP